MSTLTIATVPPITLSGHQVLDDGRMAWAGGGVSPVVELALDAGRGEVARLLDPPPLLALATLVRSDGSTFVGLVQAVSLGPSPSIRLEL